MQRGKNEQDDFSSKRNHTSNLYSNSSLCLIARERKKSVLSEIVLMSCIFTALHVMQTRYSEENSVCLSVRPSVCPSVKRVLCDKTVERYVQIYISYERTFILVF